MRIDADSCFVQPGDTKDFYDVYLPLIHNTFVYRTKDVGSGSMNSLKDLHDFAVWYMDREKLIPANQALRQYIEDSWKKRQTLPMLYTNFDVCRVSFFTNKKVSKWHQTLTEKKPFRVYICFFINIPFRQVHLMPLSRRDRSKETNCCA